MSLTLKCVGAVSGSVTVQGDATVADLFRELERLAGRASHSSLVQLNLSRFPP
jgi:hypothetical protein